MLKIRFFYKIDIIRTDLHNKPTTALQFTLRKQWSNELNVKKILAVINATYAVIEWLQ